MYFYYYGVYYAHGMTKSKIKNVFKTILRLLICQRIKSTLKFSYLFAHDTASKAIGTNLAVACKVELQG